MGTDVLKRPLTLLVVLVVVTGVIQAEKQSKWRYTTEGTGDMHGGVPMGVSNDNCDNGQDHLEVDWDNDEADYQCTGQINNNKLRPETKPDVQCTTLLDPPTHVCLPEPIHYRDPIPTAGAHRPLWARFGEYRYLPKQRWVHNLEHGCAVFLYHPCADPAQVDQLRSIARRCLRKHIITPLKKLSHETPFAVLTYGCRLLLPYVDVNRIVQFLKEHALDAPEKDVTEDGQFDVGLEMPAEVVSDTSDSIICPTEIPENGFQDLRELLEDWSW